VERKILTSHDGNKYGVIGVRPFNLPRVAGYSRGKFYAHYKHKDDLLDEIINLLFKKMIAAYRSTYIDKKSINAQKFINEPYNLLSISWNMENTISCLETI